MENREWKMANKKSIFNFLFSIVFFLMMFIQLCTTAQAAVVYLKNGRVMTGRIVEKNQQLIVLKTGEGEAATKTTIFLEDISHMESEEAYGKKVEQIPFELYRPPVDWSPSGSFAFNTTKAFYEMQKNENNSLAQNQSSLSSLNASQTQGQGSAWTIPLTPPFEFPQESTGSISGVVYLPLELASKQKGDLYAYLMKDLGNGTFVENKPCLYQKIDKENVKSSQVDYSIKNVPALESYKVFAEWDIAPPAIEERKTPAGISLRKLGFKGDYAGSANESVSVAEGEDRNSVNVSCLTFLTTSRVALAPGERPDIEIKDIRYSRISSGIEKFALVVKNNFEIATGYLFFDIWINDKKISPTPLSMTSLQPDEVREADITPVFVLFKKGFIEANPGQEFPKILKFKITWNSNGEVLFEKNISIF